MFLFWKQKLTPKQAALREQIAKVDSLRLIIGAASTSSPGWVATDVDALDITKASDWKVLFGRRKADVMMAEHVWEHLTAEQTEAANSLCFKHLKPGGSIRIAVPDGFNPDPTYHDHVRPGGSGPGAKDHKILHTYQTLKPDFERVGFCVELLEYWDQNGQFHHTDWSSDGGHIRRSRRYDKRNQDGKLGYTSLIIDAVKPTA